MESQPNTVSIQEAAKLLGVSDRTVRLWVEKPDTGPDGFPAARVISKRIRRFDRQELEAWIASRKES